MISTVLDTYEQGFSKQLELFSQIDKIIFPERQSSLINEYLETLIYTIETENQLKVVDLPQLIEVPEIEKLEVVREKVPTQENRKSRAGQSAQKKNKKKDSSDAEEQNAVENAQEPENQQQPIEIPV